MLCKEVSFFWEPQPNSCHYHPLINYPGWDPQHFGYLLVQTPYLIRLRSQFWHLLLRPNRPKQLRFLWWLEEVPLKNEKQIITSFFHRYLCASHKLDKIENHFTKSYQFATQTCTRLEVYRFFLTCSSVPNRSPFAFIIFCLFSPVYLFVSLKKKNCLFAFYRHSL